MNYHIYDNWKAKDRESPMIHKWNCGHCHMGFGKRKYANRGEYGVKLGIINGKYLRFSSPSGGTVSLKKQ